MRDASGRHLPGSKAFTVSRGKLLFILRDDNPAIEHPNCWSLPGGALEAGESPEQAFLREFREELSVTPRVWTYLGRHEAPDRPLVHRFLVRLGDDELAALRLGNEGQRFAFFPMAEIATLRTSGRLRAYLDRIAPHLTDVVERGAEPDPAALLLGAP